MRVTNHALFTIQSQNQTIHSVRIDLFIGNRRAPSFMNRVDLPLPCFAY